MRRLLLLLAFIAGCGSDKSTTGPDLSFTGTYTLRTINGSGLPFVIVQQGTTSISFTADQITIADGGTWSETGSLRTTQNGQTTNNVYSDNGTWIRSGSSIVLHSVPFNNTAYSGTFTSSQLTIADDLFAYVFSR